MNERFGARELVRSPCLTGAFDNEGNMSYKQNHHLSFVTLFSGGYLFTLRSLITKRLFFPCPLDYPKLGVRPTSGQIWPPAAAALAVAARVIHDRLACSRRMSRRKIRPKGTPNRRRRRSRLRRQHQQQGTSHT